MQIVVLAFPLLSLLLFVALFRYFLLYPQKPVRFLGFRIQGAIPAGRSAISKGIASAAARQFAAMEGLENQLVKPENFDRLKPVIENHMDDFLRNGLKEQMPMISMFIGEKTVNSLKTIFISEIEKLFPRVIGQYAGNLQKDLPIEKMIREKLDSIPDQQLTDLLSPAIKKPIAALYRLAFALGLILAGVLWLLFYLAA